MPESFAPFDNQQWQEFVNNNAAQVPAYGILRVTGVSIVEAGASCWRPISRTRSVARPTVS